MIDLTIVNHHSLARPLPDAEHDLAPHSSLHSPYLPLAFHAITYNSSFGFLQDQVQNRRKNFFGCPKMAGMAILSRIDGAFPRFGAIKAAEDGFLVSIFG
jgi:hypothetical protein